MDDSTDPSSSRELPSRQLDPSCFLAHYGDDYDTAIGELMASVQQELKRIGHAARRRVGGSPTFQTTELVHEVYIRLVGSAPSVVDSGHFLAIAARTMRWILTGRVRRHRTHEELDLEQAASTWLGDKLDLLDLDEALTGLESHNAELARIVEWKVFLGMTGREVADTIGCGEATVTRRMKVALKWLRKEMEVRDE
ncbi:MAG: ECF-type sigma factor [Planctomycetota bacterium]